MKTNFNHKLSLIISINTHLNTMSDTAKNIPEITNFLLNILNNVFKKLGFFFFPSETSSSLLQNL